MTGEAVKLTEAMRAWLHNYRDGSQNGRTYQVDRLWTRRNGNSHRGLVGCRKAGLIVSTPDATLHPNGWRHDLTEAGRSAIAGKERDQ